MKAGQYSNNFMKIKLNTLYAVCWAIVALFSASPYFVWETYRYNSIFNLLYDFIRILLLPMTVIYFQKISYCVVKIQNFIAASSFGLLYVYILFDVYNGATDFSFGTVINLLLCSSFMLIGDEDRSKIFHCFLVIFAITLVPGIIVAIGYILRIPLPYEVIQPPESYKAASGYYYNKYFFSVILENVVDLSGYRRMCAIYDEAGRVGTIAGIMLPVLPFNSSKKTDKILSFIIIVGGLMSLSVAFYVFLIILVIFKLKELNILTKKRVVKFGVIAVSITAAFYYLISTSEYFRIRIVDRLSITSLVMNNNRISDAFDRIYESFLLSNKIWFGMGSGNPTIGTVDAAGYQIVVYTFGLIGFSLLFFWMIHTGITFSERNKPALVLSIFFVMSFYQRGWVFPFYHILILCGGIAFAKVNENLISTKWKGRAGTT